MQFHMSILAQCRVESFDGTAKLEGMKQSYGTVEFFLCCLVARCGKVNLSQFLTVRMLMLLC